MPRVPLRGACAPQSRRSRRPDAPAGEASSGARQRRAPRPRAAAHERLDGGAGGRPQPRWRRARATPPGGVAALERDACPRALPDRASAEARGRRRPPRRAGGRGAASGSPTARCAIGERLQQPDLPEPADERQLRPAAGVVQCCDRRERSPLLELELAEERSRVGRDDGVVDLLEDRDDPVVLSRPSSSFPARRSTSAAFISTQASAKRLLSRRVDSTAPSRTSRASWSRPASRWRSPAEIARTDTRCTWPVARATADAATRVCRGLRRSARCTSRPARGSARPPGSPRAPRPSGASIDARALVTGAPGGVRLADEGIDDADEGVAGAGVAPGGRGARPSSCARRPQVRTPSTSRRWKASTASVTTRAISSSSAPAGTRRARR